MIILHIHTDIGKDFIRKIDYKQTLQKYALHVYLLRGGRGEEEKEWRMSLRHLIDMAFIQPIFKVYPPHSLNVKNKKIVILLKTIEERICGHRRRKTANYCKIFTHTVVKLRGRQ